MRSQNFLKRLGRKNKPDPRDHNFLIKNHFNMGVMNRPTLTQKYWDPNGWWGDQGDSPLCVGYAWAHWIEDGPIGHPGAAPILLPTKIYEEAKKVDEWPGEDYDGTSVRGAVKYLRSIGWVRSYYWAFDLSTIVSYLLNCGPMVVGTYWYSNMLSPNRVGLVRASGEIVGGHAYVLNGIDLVSRRIRFKNSWGKSWGRVGHAYISFTDMARLISQQGEACVAVEATSPPTVSSIRRA